MAEVLGAEPPRAAAPRDLQTTAAPSDLQTTAAPSDLQMSTEPSEISTEPPDLQAVYQAHVRAVYAFIYTRVGNHAAAEDLTSDVFLKALTHLDPTRAEHSVAAWLFRVARHTIADYWRAGHDAVLMPFAEGRAVHQPAPVHSTAGQDELAAARARAILGQLSSHDRSVLTCRILEGLSVAETAQQLGISAANVKVSQHRALKRAATLAEDDGYGSQE